MDSRCGAEAQGEERGLGMERGGESMVDRGARVGRHAMAWPCRSCRTSASWARAGLGSVVHLSTNGAYELAQGTKGRQ